MKENFKFVSVKRFVTFGLGLGIFMSAASGFAQTVTANVIQSPSGPLRLNGTNGAGVPTQSVTISNVGYIDARGINLGQDGVTTSGKLTAKGDAQIDKNLSVNGKITSYGTASFASGSFEIGNTGKAFANQGLAVQGAAGLTVGSLFSVSPESKVTSNGINNLDNKITRLKAGTADTDAVNVQQLNTAVATEKTRAVAREDALDAKINATDARVDAVETVVDTLNVKTQNMTATAGVTTFTGSINADSGTIKNGAYSHNTGGSEDKPKFATEAIANGDDLNKLANLSYGYTDQQVDAETSRAKKAEKKLNTRVDQEIVDRIAGDQRTLEQAQDYADAGDARTLKQANQYTDQEVKTERNRAMAAESDLDKNTSQVGAMALAAAAAAGATPVGDKKTAISAAVGSYDGQTAIAIGVTRMVNPTTKLFFTASKVLNSNKTGVAGGASFSF